MKPQALVPIPNNDNPSLPEPSPAPPSSGAAPPSVLTPDPPPIDVASLSDGDLASLAVTVPEEQARRRQKKEEAFFAAVREQAAVLGVTPARLAAAIAGKNAPRPRANGSGESDDRRKHVRPKYRDPSDPSKTWSGRGNTPPWIEIDPTTGKPAARFRIPDAEDKG